MKVSMYLKYPTRSLLRGGLRTLLAIFSVAVGVMAIVALQLVGQMMGGVLTGNARALNWGDIHVGAADNTSFKQSDLAFFDRLQSAGTITRYTPYLWLRGSGPIADNRDTTGVSVVDTSSFPVVDGLTFSAPVDGKLSQILTNDQVVVDQKFIAQRHKKLGDSFDMHLLNEINDHVAVLHVKIAGIAASSGMFAGNSDEMLISMSYYQANLHEPLTYTTVDIATANGAHTAQAVQAIKARYPDAHPSTAQDQLSQFQIIVDVCKKFLAIAGLLALLIGGVGIVNTMQVLLSRRKVEIAMLKTHGYRRFDLYLLFGLEAGLLGLIGGVIGAGVAIGLSYLVRALFQPLVPFDIPFLIDPLTVSGGVVIGLATALIFGLLPIIRAATIRPLHVLRDMPEGKRVGSRLLSIVLVFVLSVLFCLMASVILGDVVLGVVAVYGGFVFLGLLSLFFSLIAWAISKLPVPEHFYQPGYLMLVVLSIIVSGVLIQFLPAFGWFVATLSLLGVVVAWLPRSWKSNLKMALRNIGRERVRTTTTLLALFIGVFAIGLVLLLGQNLQDKMSASIAKVVTFNVAVYAQGDEARNLQANLSTIPGLSLAQTQYHPYMQDSGKGLLAIDGTPIDTLVPASERNSGNGSISDLLGSFEGFDVTRQWLPDTKSLITITAGRNLNASDAGTHNILINSSLMNNGSLKGHIRIGSTITHKGADGTSIVTMTVVGAYQNTQWVFAPHWSVLTTSALVQALTPVEQFHLLFYMPVDQHKLGPALDQIASLAPTSGVRSAADLGRTIDDVLTKISWVIIAIASFSLLAGVVIIANAVALAMLERRRELGILKSVGYTRKTVLALVLMENGIIGATGALLAMLLVALVTSIVGQVVFKSLFTISTSLDLNAPIILGLISGVALLVMFTAALVSWSAVRIRPLEVLRYE